MTTPTMTGSKVLEFITMPEDSGWRAFCAVFCDRGQGEEWVTENLPIAGWLVCFGSFYPDQPPCTRLVPMVDMGGHLEDVTGLTGFQQMLAPGEAEPSKNRLRRS